MNAEEFKARLGAICREDLPRPGAGATERRHRRLMEVGREDLSLAKLAEAHWDAVAILAEAGRGAEPGVVYGVWASEIPGKALHLERNARGFRVTGTKMFCSGAGLVDRALITVGLPDQRLVEVDLREHCGAIEIDGSSWKTEAFRLTQTGTVTFSAVELSPESMVGDSGWYVDRPGFWHGACGPAACWTGGVAGLLDAAMLSSRGDVHTLAHLAAMHTNVWAMECFLDAAAREIDGSPEGGVTAEIRALQVRHLVEQACTDTLRRFARAYGPQPLSMNAEISRRYQEADLYLRQCHGERDLEALARALRGRQAV